MTDLHEPQPEAGTRGAGPTAERPLRTAATLERLERLSWWREEIEPRLRPGAAPDLAIAAAASAVLQSRHLRHRPLGELLPGLASRCDGVPSDHVESLRARNILRRCSKDTWAEVADRSAEGMATWPNAGRKVVSEIVAAAILAWAHGDAQTDAAPEPNAPSPTRTEDPEQESGLGQSQDLFLQLCADAYRAGAQVVRSPVTC